MVKFFMMAFVYMWVRWTVLRIRYDQLQMLGWKVSNSSSFIKYCNNSDCCCVRKLRWQ